MSQNKIASPSELCTDILQEQELRSMTAGCTLGRELVCLSSIDSTNTECKRRIMGGSGEGLVIISDEQSAGRGRAGHDFLSLRGKGLYLSAVMQPHLSPMEAVNMTTWVAVAVCNAVEHVCGVRPGIKWTNDIILNGRKLGGILTEMELDDNTGALRYIVAGIGLNCTHCAEDFPAELQDIATSIAMECGIAVRRTDLAAALIRELDQMYRLFPRAGAQLYLDSYRRDCVTLGREIRILRPGQTQLAFAEDIDDDFSLLVRLPDGSRRRITSGEVSVRGICGYL